MRFRAPGCGGPATQLLARQGLVGQGGRRPERVRLRRPDPAYLARWIAAAGAVSCYLQGHVQRMDRVRQAADGDAVYSRFGELADVV